MKIIILISTITFVTLSFIGIASYYNYNHILREKGLYAEEQHGIAENPVASPDNTTNTELENTVQQTPTELDQNQQHVTAQKSPTKQSLSKQKAQKRHAGKNPVIASKRKPERKIDFEDFSRAPMREPVDIEPVEAEPVELSDITERESKPEEEEN